jgi:ABC-type multidrug transport system permease subunit
LGGGLFIQGEYENPFIVGYQESIRHRFTPFTIVLSWWIVGYQESIRHRFTPFTIVLLFLFVLFLACLFVCLVFSVLLVESES